MDEADKATLFSIIACVLIAMKWEAPFFLNFAIGFSSGAAMIYYVTIYSKVRKIFKD